MPGTSPFEPIPMALRKSGSFQLVLALVWHSAAVKSLPVAKVPRTTFSLEHCHFSASCGLWKNNGLTSLCIEDVKWPLEHVIVEVKYQATRRMFLGIA